MISQLLQINRHKEQRIQANILKNKQETQELQLRIKKLLSNKEHNRDVWKNHSLNVSLKNETELNSFKKQSLLLYRKDLQLSEDIDKEYLNLNKLEVEKNTLINNLQKIRIKQEKLKYLEEEIEKYGN